MYMVRNNFEALCKFDGLEVGPFVQNSSNLRDRTKVEESYVGDLLHLFMLLTKYCLVFVPLFLGVRPLCRIYLFIYLIFCFVLFVCLFARTWVLLFCTFFLSSSLWGAFCFYWWLAGFSSCLILIFFKTNLLDLVPTFLKLREPQLSIQIFFYICYNIESKPYDFFKKLKLNNFFGKKKHWVWSQTWIFTFEDSWFFFLRKKKINSYASLIPI